VFINKIKILNNNLYDHIKNLEINFDNDIKNILIGSSYPLSQYVLQIQLCYNESNYKVYKL